LFCSGRRRIRRKGFGILDEAGIAGVLQSLEPHGSHLGVADLVRVGAVDGELVELGAVLGAHVGVDDALAGGAHAVGQRFVLGVDEHRVLLRLVALELVEEQAAEHDGGARAPLVEVVDELLHAVAGGADVEALDGVVGAEVDEHHAGLAAGHRLGRARVDLGDLVAGPALAGGVGHGAVVLRPDHLDRVAHPPQRVLQHEPVAIAVVRRDPVRDGRPERHDAQRLAAGDGRRLADVDPGRRLVGDALGGGRRRRRGRGRRGAAQSAGSKHGPNDDCARGC